MKRGRSRDKQLQLPARAARATRAAQPSTDESEWKVIIKSRARRVAS